jgi:hypothetical protein
VGWGHVDWIDMAEERGRWPAVVNAVMNLRFPKNAGGLGVVEEPLASQEGVSCG